MKKNSTFEIYTHNKLLCEHKVSCLYYCFHVPEPAFNFGSTKQNLNVKRYNLVSVLIYTKYCFKNLSCHN